MTADDDDDKDGNKCNIERASLAPADEAGELCPNNLANADKARGGGKQVARRHDCCGCVCASLVDSDTAFANAEESCQPCAHASMSVEDNSRT